jgi:WD40 repeat protein
LSSKAKQRANLFFYEGWVTALAASPDGKLIAASGGICPDTPQGESDSEKHPGTVMWDAATGREIRTFTGHKGMVNSVTISRDGRLLLTAGADKTIRCWDVATGKQLRVLRGHAGGVTSLAVSPDGKVLASGSEDMSILLWDFDRIRRGK